MAKPNKAHLIEKHRPHWHNTGIWLGFVGALALAEAALALAIYRDNLWLIVPLVLLLGHLMHAHVIAFHEAAHGTLCPNRRLNDLCGTFVGLFSFMSLSLYRAVHHYHHAYLSTERDEELWPFNDPTSPRWFRQLAAIAELTLGLLYTPLLFLRAFLRSGSFVRGAALRRRAWAELALNAVVWCSVGGAAIWFGMEKWLLLLFVLPAALAGAMQSWRKYIEHVGLTGSTVLGSTRSIIPQGWLGRLLSLSLFNEPYHGVHHRYPKLPQTVLPDFAMLLTPTAADEPAPYPSYRSALGEMLRSLSDPRAGAQWRQAASARPATRIKEAWRSRAVPSVSTFR